MNYQKIAETLSHVKNAYAELNACVLLLNDLVGAYDAQNELADYRRSLFRIASNHEGGELSSINEKENPDAGTSGENVEFVEFTEKELQQMPKQFKTKYRIDKKTVSVRYHHCGHGCYSYELRYRANGYNISASGKTIEKAKARFLEKLKTAQRENPDLMDVPSTFSAFALYFFENFRKKKVTAQTYRCDEARLRLHILPHFREMQLKRITPGACQQLIDRIAAQGKSKTAEEIYGLLSVIFKAAILHNIIDRNPLALVQNVEYEQEHGESLTQKEETILLTAFEGSPYQAAFAVALFTGLRPNEYKTARIDGNFIVSINSKRKHKKIEYKKIPICRRLSEYLKDGFTFPCLRYMREKIREILPGHKLYDLRTTFYSRCKEFGVADAARDEFVGHSLGSLGNAYTDLSDAYLLKEGKKLDLW